MAENFAARPVHPCFFCATAISGVRQISNMAIQYPQGYLETEIKFQIWPYNTNRGTKALKLLINKDTLRFLCPYVQNLMGPLAHLFRVARASRARRRRQLRARSPLTAPRLLWSYVKGYGSTCLKGAKFLRS